MKRSVLGILLFAVPALADGPHIALHGTQGAYAVTLFTSPDPLVTGKIELALLVTQGEGGSAIAVRQAGVSMRADHSEPVEVNLQERDGAMKGSAQVSQPGDYALGVIFETARGDVVRLSGTLPVAENHGRRDIVIWSVLFPLLAVVIFLANQSAKQNLRTSIRG